MGQTDRARLFDDWAKNYDADVVSSGAGFPFDGYERVLDKVVRLADAKPHVRILDLGVGTGNLAARFVQKGCVVWGIDLSGEMLAIARAKLPQVNLVQGNLVGDWPAELQLPFDRVVSAYVLHEFDLATKIDLLQRVATHYLTPGGRILVADIAFPTTTARTEASRRWAAEWDADEYYWAADETIATCEQAGLQARYEQVSSCGGAFAFTIGGAS
jgi:putative AdoMet-dependent methyltransferase